MASGTNNRTRSDRVLLNLPPGAARRLAARLRNLHTLRCLAICALAALLMWAVTRGWRPPFGFRMGDIPLRDVVARTEFSEPDREQFERRKVQARSEAVCVYQHDVQPLVELRRALQNRVFQVLAAESWETLEPDVWQEFRGKVPASTPQAEEQMFLTFRAALKDDMEPARFAKAIENALRSHEKDGLLDKLHPREDGSQTQIQVHPIGNESFQHRVDVKDVQIAEAMSGLKERLDAAFREEFGASVGAETLSKMSLAWLSNQRFPTTLRINEALSQQARELAQRSVEMPQRTYSPGQTLARGGAALNQDTIKLLRLEHRAAVANQTWFAALRHTLADLGMYAALYVLCGFYISFHVPRLLRSARRFAALLGLSVAVVTACVIASQDQWRAESIPLALFAMTIAITHQRELALLLTASVALAVSFSAGRGLDEFVILVAGAGAAAVPCTHIRSRTKLIYVGLAAGFAVMLTTFGVGTLTGQTYLSDDVLRPWMGTRWLSWSDGAWHSWWLLQGAVWQGFCLLLAGVLMTGLLPFIEKLFDVQTDISLLELGDAAHPLLQQLAQRAPGTYNHSINVASLAAAAAESIGANGLLVRVGAYFHDIGKMLKPNYFIENQGQSPNRHESLVPAMSTLVIIAHVKDGADLARKYGLPRAILDFIEQHHGTTLVEYFYRQQKNESEDPEDVDETSFRYPGPRPQTKEAAVMMLADACESASRTLVEPAPSRIEHLVDELAMKRLLDGQFDECGLTLRELALIKESLAKSLTAVYHGRVKYSEQTA